LAAKLGDLTRVRELVDHGANLYDAEPSMNWTPLQWAASEGRTEVVRFILKKCWEPEVFFTSSLALKKGHSEIVELLESSREVEIKNKIAQHGGDVHSATMEMFSWLTSGGMITREQAMQLLPKHSPAIQSATTIP
jgi:hypothetical protein